MTKKTHIAIDGNEANVFNRVGSNVYAFEILKELEQITRNQKKISWTILLSDSPIHELPKERQGWQYKVIRPQPLWTQIALPIHLYRNQNTYDVYFSPGHYASRISVVPSVVSIMDVAYLRFPLQFRKRDLLQLKNWTAYSIKQAKKIIAISQATKQDIVKYYKKPESDIVVAYPAIRDNRKKPSKSVKNAFFRKRNIDKNFILFLGTLQPRKNLLRLIESFESVVRSIESQNVSTPKKGIGGKRKKQKSINNLQLVIAGKIGWLADDILKRVESSPFQERIILTNFVTDTQKHLLYERASALMLVGLYEGFGIPPLEAMLHGVVPIVSNNSSLPEVVGDAGIFVDPENSQSITNGIKKALLLSAKEKGKLKKEMRKQLKKFSWKKTAQTILDTLLQVATE